MRGPAIDKTEETRKCKDCGIEKLVSEFYKPRPDNSRRTCKQCQNERRKANRRANPEATYRTARKHRLKTLYNLTPDQYNEIFEAQEGRCAICLTEAPLHIDHDHVTEEVRGLLCMPCNNGLGNFDDNIDVMEYAIEYLRR